MTETNIFMEATKKKIRFETTKGMLSIEQLWDIPLTGAGLNLDEIAQDLYARLEKNKSKSFVSENPSVDPNIELGFNIVLAIIKRKKDDRDMAHEKAIIESKKRRIMEAITKKEDSQYDEVSLSELKEMLDKL